MRESSVERLVGLEAMVCRRMFGVSGRRAVYPQLFLQPLSVAGDSEGLVFLGGWEEFEMWNEQEDTLHILSDKFAPVSGGASATATSEGAVSGGSGVSGGSAVPSRDVPSSDVPSHGWTTATAPTGETFYFNHITKESSWAKPAEMGGSDWQEFLDDGSGKPYYFNRSTGETVWERPAGFVE
jgi:hypothetical protein